MPAYSAISIIYNPNSTGPSQTAAKELKKKLKSHYKKTLKINLYSTKYAGHAEKIAYKAAKSSKSPLIVSSSGDGGYNEVINGAMRAQAEGANPICAVLAAGNANDHRRTLKKRPLSDAIIGQKVEKIDLLLAAIHKESEQHIRYAHSYIGLGLTPVVAVELNKQSLNAMKELWIVLKTFYKFRPFKITVNGNIHRLDSIIFTNISEMAKILTLSKTAKIKDGKFEVVTFPHRHKLKLIGKLLKASTAGLQPKKSYEKYEFTVLKKMPMQLDGEVETIEKDSRVQISSQQQVMRTIR